MAYAKGKRPYNHEYELEKKRGEHERRMERQRARRAIDKASYDSPRDKDKTAEVREGKDVAHKKALDKGGSNKDGLVIQSAAKNRSFNRDKKGNLISEISSRERKKK